MNEQVRQRLVGHSSHENFVTLGTITNCYGTQRGFVEEMKLIGFGMHPLPNIIAQFYVAIEALV
jgi:hypothetical protein